MDQNLQKIQYSIFKIIEWINNKEQNVYLFVGTDKFKNHINKLRSNKISKDEENELKSYYNNYELLKKTINEDDVNIVYENIYEYDSIYNLKQKVCLYIHDEIKNDNINDKHIYLWTEQKKNNYEIIDILNSIFNDKTELKTEELVDIFEVLFKFKLNIKEKYVDANSIYKIIIDNNITKVNIPLELNYYDNNNNEKFIKSKPYSKIIKLHEDFVNDDGEYTPKYEYRLDNFSILKNKLTDYVINCTCT